MTAPIRTVMGAPGAVDGCPYTAEYLFYQTGQGDDARNPGCR